MYHNNSLHNKYSLSRTTLLTLLLAITCLRAAAQDEQPKSAMLFESYEWDFGTINEADGIVSHTFRFMNISKDPIQIDNIATSCGCTTVQYSVQPIQGGDYGELTVSFDPARTEGRVMREVEVFTKDRHNYASLVIWADVNPIPMGLNELYPHLLAGNIKTNTTRSNFGYVTQGETVTRVVQIANVGNKAVTLGAVGTQGYNMSVECPATIGPQEVASIRITYNIPKGKRYYGMTRDSIWIVADGTKSTQAIAVNALRVEEFSNKENTPKPVMRIEPGYVEFGEKSPGKIFKKTIVIGNTGNADLIFRNIEPCEGTAISIEDGQVVKPGKEIKVTVAITNSDKPNTTTMGSIYLTSNDPIRPFRELRLQIDTK